MKQIIATGFAILAIGVGFSAYKPTATAERGSCGGHVASGPWFELSIPTGMSALGLTDGKTSQDSVWLERGDGDARVMFFLYAPRHGGKPYQAFVDAKQVTNFVEFTTDNGQQVQFSVQYEDGSTGLFDGTSQKVTGYRVFGRALNENDLNNFECFKESVEQFAN